MKKRLKGLFLVCIMCIALTGCGTKSLHTQDIAELSEKAYGLLPINESKTMYYNLNDYHVLVLDDYYQRYGKNYIEFNDLIVNGKAVYYDTENDCFTTEPIQNN